MSIPAPRFNCECKGMPIKSSRIIRFIKLNNDPRIIKIGWKKKDEVEEQGEEEGCIGVPMTTSTRRVTGLDIWSSSQLVIKMEGSRAKSAKGKGRRAESRGNQGLLFQWSQAGCI